ncbi:MULTISPECIES: hypothetical protein [unclassified Microcoleus]|uniref:hypothetical protein n=1 Tax=unclassified Microcoleus TaxID=2642155 RepID=UPI002FD045EA
MAINVSVNKEGCTTLYINSDFIVSTDIIVWQELVLEDKGTEVICYGILSSECRGVSSYKEKEWKPAGKKAFYRVYSKEKQQWDKETNKYITVKVSKDETVLYDKLSCKAKESVGTILKGSITPWVNPFIYELDASLPSNAPLIQKMTNQLVVVTECPEPHQLTQTEITTAFDSVLVSKKGTYTAPESESKRLLARYEFFQSQLEDFDYKSLSDLACQIEGLKEDA